MGQPRHNRFWWRPVWQVMVATFARRMWLGAALGALTVIGGIGLLGVSGWFIAATAIAGLQLSTALAFDVFMPSATIRFLALLRTGARYGERVLTHDATLATIAQLRERLFLGWAQAVGNKTLRQPANALLRLTADLDSLESLTLRLLVPSIAAAAAALLCALVFGFIAPWFGLLSGLWLLLVGLGVTAMLAWQARAPTVRYSLALERLRLRSIDLVSGQTDLLMAQQFVSQCRLLQRDNRRVARADHRLNRLEIKATLLHSVASSVTVALALLGAAGLVQNGFIEVPGAVLIVLMALAALEPFTALRRGALEAGRTWLAARRLATPLGATAMPLRQGQVQAGYAVVFSDVSSRYEAHSSLVLKQLDFAVAEGEKVAIIGPSGAGKSSIFALITGELPADSGRVAAIDHAWLSQHVYLFHDSIRENLLLAAPQATDEQLWQALEQAGLAADIGRFSRGLDTQLGEDAVGLSGGQARRLALARLLLQKQRRLWLLDEPTDGLDRQTANTVLQSLSKHGKSKTWLLATHLQREAKLADRLLVLEEGCLVASCLKGTASYNAALARLRTD